MIESRGCAFVTMATRFDADSALRYMKHKRIDSADVKVNPVVFRSFDKTRNDVNHRVDFYPSIF